MAKAKGYDVFVSDKGTISPNYKKELELNAIEFEEGGHSKKKILTSRLVIKSPGISDSVKIVQRIAEANIKIIDEIEFAFSYTKAKIIAITGTNGKTTTTLLTYHLLKEAGLSVGIAGNVGQSLAKQVLKDEYDYYVIEMSSFQLDRSYLLRPYISILLNITPDHMDRYEYKLENYVSSKFRIVQNADREDHFIYYADNELIKAKRSELKIDTNEIGLSLQDEHQSFFDGKVMKINEDLIIAQSDTALYGKHNAINMMAAINTALILGVDESVIREGLKTFKNAPHRMEYIETINDVRFINDSKATNVDAVSYALDSFSDPLVWIAGGEETGKQYGELMEVGSA